MGLTNPHLELTGELLRNWKRNEQLIDLTFTPADIQQKILEEFEKESNKGKEKLLPYLISKKLKTLTEQVCDF